MRLLQSLPEEGDIAVRLSSRKGGTREGYFLLNGLKVVREKLAAARNGRKRSPSQATDGHRTEICHRSMHDDWIFKRDEGSGNRRSRPAHYRAGIGSASIFSERRN